jgi:hypothetical protein
MATSATRHVAAATFSNRLKPQATQLMGLIRSADQDLGSYGPRIFFEPYAAGRRLPDNIVSNPPFGLCDSKKGKPGFVELALRRAQRKVALLMPANWVQGDKRSRWLETTPLQKVLFLSPRPSMPPGQVLEAGVKPGNGTTDYAWFVWERGHSGAPTIGWLRRDP